MAIDTKGLTRAYCPSMKVMIGRHAAIPRVYCGCRMDRYGNWALCAPWDSDLPDNATCRVQACADNRYDWLTTRAGEGQ